MANFKPKTTTAAASRGFSAAARLSCYIYCGNVAHFLTSLSSGCHGNISVSCFICLLRRETRRMQRSVTGSSLSDTQNVGMSERSRQLIFSKVQ